MSVDVHTGSPSHYEFYVVSNGINSPDSETLYVRPKVGPEFNAPMYGSYVDSDANGSINAGDTIEYEIIVRNVGACPLPGGYVNGITGPYNPALDFSGSSFLPIPSLPVDASVSMMATYTITAQDIANGYVFNETIVAHALGGISQAYTPSCYTDLHYDPLLGNPAWIYEDANGLQTMGPGTDVDMGSYVYKRFVDPSTDEEFLLREDLEARSVYRLNDDFSESLLFNFAAEASDWVTLPTSGSHRVTQVDMVEVLGGVRKRMRVEKIGDPSQYEIWIEGVGNPEHPLRPRYTYSQFDYFDLMCSFQGNTNVYNRGIVWGETPSDCVLLGTTSEMLPAEFAVTPNPLTDRFTIHTKHGLQQATAVMTNLMGQTVREWKNINGQDPILERGDLRSGVYFLHLSDNGKTSVKKVMVAD
jgi:hypothetical protein